MIVYSIFALTLMIGRQNAQPDFTGVWKLNEARTIGAAHEEMESIEHNDPVFKITFHFRQLDVIRSASYVLDGQNRTNSATKVNARWEGRTAVIDTTTISNGKTIHTHEALTLSDDGATLTKKSESDRWGSVQTSKMIFDRISTTAHMNHFEIGSSPAEVKGAWGEPDEIEGSEPKVTFVYFNWLCGRSRMCRRSVTFVDGKVSEIH